MDENYENAPVWRCKECYEHWTDFELHEECPGCYAPQSAIVKTDFTYGQAEKVAEQLGFDVHEIRRPHKPPFKMVPLVFIPEKYWVGLPVFLASSQKGFNPPYKATWYRYDVGVVFEIYPDPDFDQYGDPKQVRFMTTDGSSLHYSAGWLWVPEEIVKYLHLTLPAEKETVPT